MAFFSTVENIQLGFVQYDDEHILKVSKIAGVDDYGSLNPSGYDLQLKEEEGFIWWAKTVNKSLKHKTHVNFRQTVQWMQLQKK